MDSEACKGTVWGLYNAVVECEDYRRGGSEKSRATSAVIGDRAVTKQRAFDVALTLCTN